MLRPLGKTIPSHSFLAPLEKIVGKMFILVVCFHGAEC